jgi:AcrR family transcriptional regulator
MVPSVRQRKDRRIQRTEELLRGALGALIREKPYEDIVVKEILGRANVGRSTFYAHFDGKDDLLRNCVHHLVQPAGPQGGRQAKPVRTEDILWFSLPILEHVERHRPGPGTGGVGKWQHEQLREPIAELIAAETGRALHDRAVRRVPPDLLVRWVVSTFVLVLNWWLEIETPLPAREADRLFRALVEPSLAQVER